MRRSRVVVLAAGASLLWSALPASAHVGFTAKSVPKGSEEVLDIYVPVEEAGHNAEVKVDVPAGFGALYCYAEPGWSCTTEPAATGVPASFTYSRTSAAPTTEDTFSFGVQTPKKAGSYGFGVTQKYSTGSTVEWKGAAGSSSPAAYITVK